MSAKDIIDEIKKNNNEFTKHSRPWMKGIEKAERRIPLEVEEPIDESKSEFAEYAARHGYIKARQFQKQAVVKENLKKIVSTEIVARDVRKSFRLSEVTKISNTAGAPSSEGPIDKIIEVTDAKPGVPQGDETQNDMDSKFYTNIALKKAMINEGNELICSQLGLEYLPISMGDTLYMQLGFVKSMSCTLNSLTSILSYRMPQLSMNHIRYLTTMNLSGNKINQLPSDLGCLKVLRTFNLSSNNLSALPSSISRIVALTSLDLSRNFFSSLCNEVSRVQHLTELNLSQNNLSMIPSPIPKIKKLRILDLSKNTISHLAVLNPLNKPSDLWMRSIDNFTAKTIYINVLTKEKVWHPDEYDGSGIANATDLHIFQPREAYRKYFRRRLWLSINQIYEWEPCIDDNSGRTYFRNNVSGETRWEIPEELDTLGNIEMLENLILNNNIIKGVCPSIVKLTQIRRLLLQGNRFSELPEDFGKLQKLEYFDLHGCECRFLPTSICDIASLTMLNCSGNMLVRLPDLLGTLPALKTLDCSGNRLNALPFSLGYCKSLTDLFAQENPLVDPPNDELSKGLDQLKWYCRQRLMIDRDGMPPVMEYHDISIRHEITIVKPELTERLQLLIRTSMSSGLLNLQLMGYDRIPNELLRLKKLKKLKFDFNDKLRITDMPEEFSILKMLSFRSCKMPSIPENIHNLKRIATLQLEENLIEILPNSFTKLRTLTSLDISKNRLYQLPEGFENLQILRTLNLESNNIEVMPTAFSRMSVLMTLSLAKNRIVDVPDVICDISSLRKLNLEMNRLTAIPNRIGQLFLIELRLGHNRLEFLPEDMFAGNLGETCKLFSVCENNLLQLPESLASLDHETLVEADFNPLRSPPQYLLSEGLVVVQHYLFIRKVRMNELLEMLEAEDFSISREHVTPTACEVIEDGAGFLSPTDLAEFDKAVDEYCNNEYFKCPASAKEIVSAVTKLREYRETDLYLTILKTALSVIAGLIKARDKRWGEAVLMTQERPWGRKGENVKVWVIKLEALLRDKSKNKVLRADRQALISLISDALPEMPFHFDGKLLKDALQLYHSPYGQISSTERCDFPKCECVDDKKGKPKKHNPCTDMAVVLAKSIYTEEEADRREIEEDNFIHGFEEIENEIKVWLMTEEGKLEMAKEIKRRAAAFADDIDIREEMINRENIIQSKIRGRLARAEAKKKQFEDGEPFEVHGFKTLEEAMKEYNTENDAYNKSILVLEGLEKQLEQLQILQALPPPQQILRAQEDLIQKYCCENYNAIVVKYRQHASYYGNLNRYWDGEDGKSYLAWYKKFGGMKLSSKKTIPPQDLTKLHDQAQAELDVKRAHLKKEIEDSGKNFIDFNWEGTDDMSKYNAYIYFRYKNSKMGFAQYAAAAGKMAKSIGKTIGKMFGL